MFFVISRFYSAVSLTLVREQRFVRIIIFIILADLYGLVQIPLKKKKKRRRRRKSKQTLEISGCVFIK